MTNDPREVEQFEKELRLLKLRFIGNASPLDISAAIDRGDLTHEEFAQLHEELQCKSDLEREHLYINLRYRISVDEPGDYDVDVCGVSSHAPNKITLRRIR